ncbi:MAG: PriCT-2 domain-containing protein [Magnetococcales bacterium]|nr:PriCT-2 domain-containing protein [Magnetococcales bacterium]
MSENFMTQYGDQLAAGGFPFLPIVPGEKFPGRFERGNWLPYKGWTKHAARATTAHELSIWKQWPDAGIGIPCGLVAGVDIDIADDIDLAQRLQFLAFELLGATPAVRIGNAPKRMLVYRTDAPFKGIKAHPLEVLCQGQQFVAYAIHPGTGRPYEWPVRSLADLTLADLPVITEEQAHAFIEQGLALLPEGMRPVRLERNPSAISTRSSALKIVVNTQEGTPEAIQDALRHIVNADLPYDDWVRVGMAIKGALGEAGAGLFADWSASSAKNIPETTDRSWASFRPTVIGAGTIYHLAQRHGWKPDATIVLNPANQHPGPHPAAPLLQKMPRLSVAALGENAPPFLDGPEWNPTDLDGVLSQLVNYMVTTATRPQPILAVGNALCALGALMGRRYRTETDVRSNLYVVGIADSGSGKNHSREVITDLLFRAGLKKFLGGNRIASGSGLLRAIHDHPAILFQQDEFGMFLQAAADRKRSPKHITDILDLMTELYSSSATVFLGPEYATPDKKGRQDINQPCLCLYGTTTPALFWSALKSANVADGSLARFLILKTQDDYPEASGVESLRQPPEELVAALAAIAQNGSGGDGNLANLTTGPETAINPQVVPMKPAVWERFAALNRQVTGLLRRSRGSQFSPILARVWENAAKVALIRAVSADPAQPVIREEDAVWAIAMVRYAVNTFIEDVERFVADNQTEQNHKRVLEVLRKAGRKGITQGDVSQKLRFLERRPRMEVLQTLIESGQVISEIRLGRTKPTTIYRAV